MGEVPDARRRSRCERSFSLVLDVTSVIRAALGTLLALVLAAVPLTAAGADDPPPADPDPIRGLVLPPLD